MVEKNYKGNFKEYNLYGYAPPFDARFSKDEKGCLIGEDFRNTERYKEYKEAGFNTLLAQMTALYSGEEWESSQTKKVMDLACSVGIEKVVLLDKTIMELSRVKGGLIGAGKEFNSESELDERVAQTMKDYKNHKAFYGVQIVDEPSFEQFESIGQIYRSIKRVCPTAFVQCNLFPLAPYRMINAKFPQGRDIFDRFEKYVEGFLDATGADYFMYDCYPFESKPVFMPMFLRGLQISANIAKKRYCEFHFVAQAFSMKLCGKNYHLKPTTTDMIWQINLLLAHGVNDFGYYTYWSKCVYDENCEWYPDDSGMLTVKGEKTATYYDVKSSNEKIGRLAPVLSHFAFNKTTFALASFRAYPSYENYIYSEDNPRLKVFKTDKEQAIINEFINGDGEYLYALVNATPSGYTYPDGEAQNSTVVFKEDYDYADVYINGWQTVEIKDNTLSVSLKIGEAAYIIPFKKGVER